MKIATRFDKRWTTNGDVVLTRIVLAQFLLTLCDGVSVGLVLDQLVLNRLEVLLVELREVHEHQLVVRLEAVENLDVAPRHRLHVWRRLRQVPAEEEIKCQPGKVLPSQQTSILTANSRWQLPIQSRGERRVGVGEVVASCSMVTRSCHWWWRINSQSSCTLPIGSEQVIPNFTTAQTIDSCKNLFKASGFLLGKIRLQTFNFWKVLAIVLNPQDISGRNWSQQITEIHSFLLVCK